MGLLGDIGSLSSDLWRRDKGGPLLRWITQLSIILSVMIIAYEIIS